MTTFSGIPGDSQCECADKECPKHLIDSEKRTSICQSIATTILYRTDMEDNTGTAMCDECSEDAIDSGVFAEYDPDLDETI